MSPASRKVARAGRRWGKTRWAFKAAIVGHGPEGKHQRDVRGEVAERWTGPKFRGIAHNRHVYWIARDNPQFNTLWFEEIVPRFKGKEKAGVTVNQTEKRVEIPGGGMLWARTAENITSVRGSGANLIGVIIDEAAWQDLEDELKSVVLPALLDNGGWLVLISTTNSGVDGNKKKRIPSYFNVICEEIHQSEAARADGRPEDAPRTEEWAEFYGTAYDNPKLDPEAIGELIGEYRPDSVELAQEVFAKLVKGGSGLAFPEWREDLLLTSSDFLPPKDWPGEVGFDWGYGSPGWAGYNAFGPNGKVHLARELVFNGQNRGGWEEPNQPPVEIGKRVGTWLQNTGLPMPRRIVADIPDDLKDGRGGNWQESIKEEFERGLALSLGRSAPRVERQEKSNQSRAARKLKMHEMIRFTEVNGKVPPWCMPLLSIHPSCFKFLTTVSALPLDEDDPEDVDTTAYDHPYDGETGLLVARPKHAVSKKKPDPPDTYRAPDPAKKKATEPRFTFRRD